MLLEHQISLLVWFLKNETLKTEVMMQNTLLHWIYISSILLYFWSIILGEHKWLFKNKIKMHTDHQTFERYCTLENTCTKY